MSGLAAATAVRPEGDGFVAELSADWQMIGPSGGYLAAVALRAGAGVSELDVPVSLTCHYLAAPSVGPAQITIQTLRRSSKSESLLVSMAQGERMVLQSMLWMSTERDGPVHQFSVAPDVPAPAELLPTEELTDKPFSGKFPIFRNFEERPTNWLSDAEFADHEVSDPRVVTWFRYRPDPVFDDLVVDACRSVILLDTMQWLSVLYAHPAGLPYFGVSMDLHIRFHTAKPAGEWLLTETVSPVARAGLAAVDASVWAEDGALVATGDQQMTCLPIR